MKSIFIILFIGTGIIAMLNSCEHEPLGMAVPGTGTGGGGGGGGGPVSGGSQPCSTDTVYFQNQVLPLLISSCAKSNCHDAASHQDGIELTSYQKVVTTADVDPFDPNDSELYKVLNETDPDKRMPRPPSSPLTAAEKNIIFKWIQQGAKNNACFECDTTTITYSGALVPLINGNCKGCHNPSFLSAGLDLTAYANVKTIALNGKLVGVIDHQPGFPAMPKGAAKLNDCKITQVKKWIAAGALNN